MKRLGCHQHICQLYQVVETEDTIYLVMEVFMMRLVLYFLFLISVLVHCINAPIQTELNSLYDSNADHIKDYTFRSLH